MPMDAFLFSQVQSLIADLWSLPPQVIRRDSRFEEDLGMRYLDIAELIVGVEDAFHLTFPYDAFATMKTVNDVVRYIALREPLAHSQRLQGES